MPDIDNTRHVRAKNGRTTLCGAPLSELDLYYDHAKKRPGGLYRCAVCEEVIRRRQENPGHPIAPENLARCPYCGGLTSKRKLPKIPPVEARIPYVGSEEYLARRRAPAPGDTTPSL